MTDQFRGITKMEGTNKQVTERLTTMKSTTLAVCVAALAALAGCSTYKGGKIVEGTDIAAGMSVPQSGGTFQIDALNFLTGFRFLFCDNAGVKCVYSTTNSVSAFGVYSSTTVKRIEIELTPTLDEAEDDEPKTE